MATILVVDDHLPTRELLRALLQHRGDAVVLAENAAQGLAAAVRQPPDLIFTDVVMPGMDGFGFVAELRKSTPCKTTPVILMSASLESEKAAALARRCGAIDYLAKPVEPETVLDRVSAVLGAVTASVPPGAPDTTDVQNGLRTLFVESLGAKVEELERLNRDLEQRVAERTHELARANELLKEQAIRDALTGMFNRRYLDETLPRELERCKREHLRLAAALLDIDHFKSINDRHGHEAGDQVLRKVGQALAAGLRASDLACRYGGEEFAIVMPGASREGALRRLDALRASVTAASATLAGREIVRVTLSGGLAMYPDHALDANGLLSSADGALNRAKHAGRDRIVVCD